MEIIKAEKHYVTWPQMKIKVVKYYPSVCYVNKIVVEEELQEEPIYYWDEISNKRKEQKIGVKYFVWNKLYANGHQYYFRSLKVFLAYSMLEIEQWIPYRSLMCSYVQTAKDRPIWDERYKQNKVNFFNKTKI